jgi:calcineurin-like phosphoesterase family protein
MKIYLTTDTHFFHDRMVEFCGRPQDHTQITGKNLLQLQVEPTDILIHLGDIAMGHDQEAHDQFIKPLKMRKWLVKGNHDRKSDHWYLENGWDFVCNYFNGTFFQKNIVFSHIPVAWDHRYDLNIHGHFHNTNHRNHEPELVKIENSRQKLLAIEYTNYKPILLEDFIDDPPTGKTRE